MEQLLLALLGQNAFGGPGGPGGLGDPAEGEGILGGLGDKLGGMAKTFQAIQPPTSPKPIMNAGVSGAQLPFQTQLNDIINPALNAMAQRRASTPNLPTFAQLLQGR